ncbi:MAG: large subunit ribosomal protein L25 [Parcubacteria group bacterium Gr01-1014_29]|nr:MAG: large subunit ribosomal protein L25 [Parcubacteria group bacterium Gr01-1014_29]
MLELAVKPRKELGKKAKNVRKTGTIPAILYGYGVKPQPLQVELRAFQKVWQSTGESSLVSLQLEGGSTQTVLIYDVARDVLKDIPMHVDFYAVRMDRPLEAHIPITFTGESDAVKSLGGILVKVAHTLEIRALPQNLPHEISVDITPLHALDDQLFVKDITLPEGVEALADPEQVLVLVEAPRTEEELSAMEQPSEVSLENIEVAGKKEKEEEPESEEVVDVQKKEQKE